MILFLLVSSSTAQVDSLKETTVVVPAESLARVIKPLLPYKIDLGKNFLGSFFVQSIENIRIEKGKILFSSLISGKDISASLRALAEDMGEDEYDVELEDEELRQHFQQALDAQIELNGRLVTSDNNSIVGAIDGVTLNLVAADVGVTKQVTVANDTAAVKAQVDQFINSYNLMKLLQYSLDLYTSLEAETGHGEAAQQIGVAQLLLGLERQAGQGPPHALAHRAGELDAADLDGAFFRVAPDPHFPPKLGDDIFFGGDGAVTRFRIKNGKVDMKHRYVRTPKFEMEEKAGRALWGAYRNPLTDDESTKGVRRTTANTNVLEHAGKLWALKEDSPPVAMDLNTLETEGLSDFGGKMTSDTFTTHPKIDPKTGNLIREGVESIMNPEDRHALEAALHAWLAEAPAETTDPETINPELRRKLEALGYL